MGSPAGRLASGIGDQLGAGSSFSHYDTQQLLGGGTLSTTYAHADRA